MRGFVHKTTTFFIVTLIILSLSLVGWHFFLKSRGYQAISFPHIIGSLPHAITPQFNSAEHSWYFWNADTRAFNVFNTVTTKTSILPATLPENFSVLTNVIWSPNNQLVVIEGNAGKALLNLKAKTNFALPATAQNFVWSLDSDNLAYRIIKPESIYLSEIYTLNVNSGEKKLITTLDRTSSFFTNGQIHLAWGPENILFFSDIVLDATSGDWEALTPTSTYTLADLDLVNFSPDQTKLLFTRSNTNETGEQITWYGIKTLVTDQEKITRLPDSWLCDWETSDTLLCLSIDQSQDLATIGQYNVSTGKYLPLKPVKISSTQLPNNNQFIQFDTKLRQLYVVTGGGTVYSIDY